MAQRKKKKSLFSPRIGELWHEHRRLLLVAPLFLLFFFILNAPYFWARFIFWIQPPQEVVAVVEPAAPEVVWEPNRVIVTSLGIDAPMSYVETKGEKVYQEALMLGVVHYPGTAMPGELGNVYIFGHSSDLAWKRNPYATVFALLTEIEVGAEIVVTDATGQPFVYVVEDTRVVGPNDLSVLSQGDNAEKRLTLQTSYPIGTALQRFLVLAKLKE